MPLLELAPLGWDCNHPTRPECCGLETLDFNTARGFLEADKGYVIDRQITLSGYQNNAGGSWMHRHSDGTEWIWFYSDTDLFVNDGSTPTSIASGLTERFAPSQYNVAYPCGHSGFFNGTNSQARLVRKSGSTLAAPLHDFAAPGSVNAVALATGGTFAAGTYLVRVCWLDDAGSVVVYTAPSSADSAVLALNDRMSIPEPSSAPARATKWRYGITAPNATDAPENYLYYADVAVGAGTQTLTALPTVSTTQAFASRNGVYRQATLAISGVDVCTVHEGRLFYASTASGEVGFSERGNTNHFYADDIILAGTETGWGGTVTGLCSASGAVWVFTTDSIHAVTGRFLRDSYGPDPTYALEADPEVTDRNIGCVSHASIVVHGNVPYFFSTRGPAALLGGRARLLLPELVRPFLESHLDWTYASRIVGAEDPDLNGFVCWLVPRRTNSSRAMDGAATAGICDRILRFDTGHGIWSPPRWFEGTHISTRPHGSQGSTANKTWLCGVGCHASAVRFGLGRSGGGPADTSGATYDATLGSANTTTTVTAYSGLTNDAQIGRRLVLAYPSADSAYPSVFAIRTIADNDGTTLTWTGALTVPSTSFWTAFIAGSLPVHDPRFDPRLLTGEIPPGHYAQVLDVKYEYVDVVGREAVS